MKKSTLAILIVSLVALFFIVTSAIFYRQRNIARSVQSQPAAPSTATVATKLPTDPFGNITPDMISILAAKYPSDEAFIQEVEDQLGSFGITETLVDPANPRRIYYTFSTDSVVTQVRYYDPTIDTTYSYLHWPIVQNGSLNLTNGLSNVPKGDIVHPVDVINDALIYAEDNNTYPVPITDTCESLILHYYNQHQQLYSINEQGIDIPFTPSSALIASETQAQQSCETKSK
jgi:hypothetical protein